VHLKASLLGLICRTFPIFSRVTSKKPNWFFTCLIYFGSIVLLVEVGLVVLLEVL